MGYVEFMIFEGKGMNVRNISLQFLVVPCNNVYNFILGRPFASALDVVASLVDLKLKFHNLHGKPVTVNIDI